MRIKIIKNIAEHLHSLIDGLCKALLLHTDQLLDHRTLFRKLRIRVQVLLDHSSATSERKGG